METPIGRPSKFGGEKRPPGFRFLPQTRKPPRKKTPLGGPPKNFFFFKKKLKSFKGLKKNPPRGGLTGGLGGGVPQKTGGVFPGVTFWGGVKKVRGGFF